MKQVRVIEQNIPWQLQEQLGLIMNSKLAYLQTC